MRFQSEDHHNRRKTYQAMPSRSATPASSKRGAPPASAGAYRTDHSRGLPGQGAPSHRGPLVYGKALRKRQVWVEPLFAEAKEWHGRRRFRPRRLEKAYNIEALPIASGQNAKRLHACEAADRGSWLRRQPHAHRVPAAMNSSSAREHRSSRSSARAFFNALRPFRTFDTAANDSSAS
jgi:hypothetical protein